MVERVLGAIFENATAPTQAYVTRWVSDPCESSRRLLSLSLARALSHSSFIQSGGVGNDLVRLH
jgi:hypothetical protein